MTIRSRFDPLVVVALCASAFVNVLLARQVLHQRALVAVMKPPTPVRVGEFLPRTTALDLEHRTISLDPRAHGGSVIYVFSPTCHFCDQNHANALVVARVAATKGYRVLGISMIGEGLSAYLASSPLPFPVVVANDSTRTAYHLSPTPETFVVDPGGKVLKHWLGAWRDDTAAQVEAFFNCRLPGLHDRLAAMPFQQ